MKTKHVISQKLKTDLTESIMKMVRSGASHGDICSFIETSLRDLVVADLIKCGVSERDASLAFNDVAAQVKQAIVEDVASVLLDGGDKSKAKHSVPLSAGSPLQDFMETVESALKGDRPFDGIHLEYHDRLVRYFLSRGCSPKEAEQKTILLNVAMNKDWQEIISLARIDDDGASNDKAD